MAVLRVLVVNAGSSSLKIRLLDPGDRVVGSHDLPAPRGAADAGMLKDAISSFGDVDAVGHRIVHGGTLFRAPVVVDAGVRQRLETLTDLAPLHQPKSLAALDAVQAALPDVPGVACFDTAFHATIPEHAATFALPAGWRARWTLRRYGFHGLSHEYVSRRAAEVTGGASRIVSCHLGAGATGRRPRRQVCRYHDGVHAAGRPGHGHPVGVGRPGPGARLQEHAGTPAAELAATLEYRSGLFGLAGTADMREILSRAAGGDARCELAREVYLHRLLGCAASMAAAMSGLDVLVFTGGVGENSAEIRWRAMEGLAFLGVRPDSSRNEAGTGDREIGSPDAAVRSLVISAREDLEIARQVRSALGDQT